jgi:hypothetical protein
VAKWLVGYFKLSAEDARADENYALHVACAYGRLDIAKWLVATFSLTEDDARDTSHIARWRNGCDDPVTAWLNS